MAYFRLGASIGVLGLLALLVQCQGGSSHRPSGACDMVQAGSRVVASPGMLAAEAPAPQARPASLRLSWPLDLKCERWNALEVTAEGSVQGFLGQRPDGVLRFSFPELEQQQKRKDEEAALEGFPSWPARSMPPIFERVQNLGIRTPDSAQDKLRGTISLHAGFRPDGMEEIAPTVDSALFKREPARLDLKLRFSCVEPVSVLFECRDGSCKTTLFRGFPQATAIGRSYLGPGGWRCVNGCSPNKPLVSLLRANVEQLRGEERETVLRLGHDLLAEMAQVIEVGCGAWCSASPLEAARLARRLLGRQDLRLSQVKLRRKEPFESAKTQGFIAQLTAGNLRWQLTCTREIDKIGRLGVNITDSCDGVLLKDGHEIVYYSPQVDWAETRNGPVWLDAYVQHVIFEDGELHVETGHRYSSGSSGSHRSYEFGLERKRGVMLSSADYWEQGPVSGIIRITGAAQRTKVTEELDHERVELARQAREVVARQVKAGKLGTYAAGDSMSRKEAARRAKKARHCDLSADPLCDID